jgi:membrane associated rhomboid family serine protease
MAATRRSLFYGAATAVPAFFLLFGSYVEEELGAERFLGLLALAATAGHVAVWYAMPHSLVAHIGASGGIAGVMGFYAVRFPGAKVSLMTTLWYRPTWIHIPAPLAILAYFLLQMLGSSYQMAGKGDGISYLSHVGGLVLGMALALMSSGRVANPRPCG